MNHISAFFCFLIAISTISLQAESLIDAHSFMVVTSVEKSAPKVLQSTKKVFINSANANVVFQESASTLTIEHFPVDYLSSATIILERVESTVDASSKILVGNTRIPLPIVHTFHGHIENEPSSEITISYANGSMYCWIQQKNGKLFSILPTESNHILYSREDLASTTQQSSGMCLTDESSITIPTPEDLYASFGKREVNLDNRLLELEIVVESTTSFFNGPGRKDSVKAAEFIIALMNGVNTIYRKELNVTIVLPMIQIWTASNLDPYKNDGSDTPALLDEVGARWNTISTVKRDIVHCMDAVGNSGTGNGTFVLGIANGIGNICSGAVSNAYSVSGIMKNGLMNISDYLGDITTIAHEIGHNIGSYHTHNCNFWPPRGLDSCMTSGSNYTGRSNFSYETCYKSAPVANPGSIMSYCHLTNSSRSVAFTFLPRVYTYLRTYLESKKCIEAATLGQIKMIYPWGQQRFVVGSKQLIEWTSNKVQNVDVHYSKDGGITWRTIFASRPAVSPNSINGQGSIEWIIPNEPTKTGRIRVVDAANNSVKDTSWVDFEISAPSLGLTTNLANAKIGFAEKVSVKWTKDLVDRVKIEFSSNNQQSWSIIKDSLTSTLFTVDFPDVESNLCYIRVVSLEDNKLLSLTGPFSLGKESIQLLNPKPYDTICTGKSTLIQWKPNNIAFGSVYLEYKKSTDPNWTRINSLGITANPSEYSWNVPEKANGSTLFRVSYKSDTSINSTPQSVIITNTGSCSSVMSIDNNDSDKQWKISPNPAGNTCFLEYSGLPLSLPITITLTDIKGRFVATLLESFIAETSSFQIPISLIPFVQGSYFITVSYGKQGISLPISIQR